MYHFLCTTCGKELILTPYNVSFGQFRLEHDVNCEKPQIRLQTMNKRKLGVVSVP